MKAVIFLFVVSIVGIFARPDDKYTTKYDDIDLDAVLNNERLLKKHHECLMERGPCTSELTVLRDVLADALATDCGKCSEKQKNGAKKVIKFLYDHHKDNYEELKTKYDPDNKYIEKYRDLAAKEGIAK